MICSSSAGDPNTLYYVSRNANLGNITHVLVEQKVLDVELSAESDLGLRWVVLRTNRGDYQCKEPLDGFTIALMLRCLDASIDGVIEAPLKSMALSIESNMDRFWERFWYVQSVCETAQRLYRYPAAPLAQTGTRVATAGDVAIASTATSGNVPTVTSGETLSTQPMATRNHPKREAKPVDRYKPRPRSAPKKQIAK